MSNGPRVTTRNRYGEKRGSIADIARTSARHAEICVCDHRRDDHYAARITPPSCYTGCDCTAFTKKNES